RVLDDPVERDEFGDDQLAHDDLLVRGPRLAGGLTVVTNAGRRNRQPRKVFSRGLAPGKSLPRGRAVRAGEIPALPGRGLAGGVVDGLDLRAGEHDGLAAQPAV